MSSRRGSPVWAPHFHDGVRRVVRHGLRAAVGELLRGEPAGEHHAAASESDGSRRSEPGRSVCHGSHPDWPLRQRGRCPQAGHPGPGQGTTPRSSEYVRAWGTRGSRVPARVRARPSLRRVLDGPTVVRAGLLRVVRVGGTALKEPGAPAGGVGPVRMLELSSSGAGDCEERQMWADRGNGGDGSGGVAGGVRRGWRDHSRPGRRWRRGARSGHGLACDRRGPVGRAE